MSIILAIESSCDDTSASIIKDGEVLSNIVCGQKVHKSYGGVVPELASRQHLSNIVPTVETALKEANIDYSELNAVAFTRGPGLLGSLIVGLCFAKGLALSQNIPLIEVDHMRAHVLAHFAEDPKPSLPFLCLTVSGGHTQIIKVKDIFDFELLGTTIDDAAGEAFDKTGKMLGLDYPAGPIIDKLAKEGKARFDFTTPKVDGYNFSFSGLKTAIMYFIKAELKKDPDFVKNNINDICASVQKKIVDILLATLERAAKDHKITNLAIAGGVSANSELRIRFEELATDNNWKSFIPRFAYCTDNAAMVGVAGYFKFLKKDFSTQDVTPAARVSWS